MKVGRTSMVLFGLVFLLTPLTLDASPWLPDHARQHARVRSTTSQVHGLRVTSRVDPGATKGLTAALAVHNPTRRTITAKLNVEVYSRPLASRFARMMPRAVRHGSKAISVRVKPGARIKLTSLVKKGLTPKPKQLPTYYVVVRPVGKKTQTIALRK